MAYLGIGVSLASMNSVFCNSNNSWCHIFPIESVKYNIYGINALWARLRLKKLTWLEGLLIKQIKHRSSSFSFKANKQWTKRHICSWFRGFYCKSFVDRFPELLFKTVRLEYYTTKKLSRKISHSLIGKIGLKFLSKSNSFPSTNQWNTKTSTHFLCRLLVNSSFSFTCSEFKGL